MKGGMDKYAETYQVEIALDKRRVNIIVHCESQKQADFFYEKVMADAEDGLVSLEIETSRQS